LTLDGNGGSVAAVGFLTLGDRVAFLFCGKINTVVSM
jgi:hypothetical protein